MHHLFRRAGVLAALITGLGGATASADVIRVQSTTDTVDAGLVDGLLRPMYQAAQPGDTIQYTAVGTGKALDNARAGLGDVVITHAPSLEAKFVADGFSLEPYGRAIFYSDYVIVGPADDPAGAFTGSRHDAVTTFEKIAAAGAAGTATFVSRGDNSGTNVQEQIIWGLTGAGVQKQTAQNAAGAGGRFEPWTGAATDYPNWYEKSQKGQAANLQQADVCATTPANPNGGCYTMVDRGTFNRLLNAGTLTKLKIVTDKSTPGVRGGENLLINPFSAYIVNPAAVSGLTTVNVPAAQRFMDFLTSESFQGSLDTWPSASDPAFRADAFPKVDLDASLPVTGVSGRAVPMTVTVTNRLPGEGVVPGIPLQLQRSTNGGKTFTDVGAPVTTDAAGRASFTPKLLKTTTFRVRMDRYRQFSPSTSTLGVVADLAPQVTKIRLTAKRLALTVNEAATVRVAVSRRTTRTVRVKGKKRTVVVLKRVKNIRAVATRPGQVARSVGALRPGVYQLTVRADDVAGNVTKRVVRLTVRSVRPRG